MAVDHVVGEAEFEADFADFVFEEFAQGFDQFELHVLGETAHVVVGFDDVGAAGFRGGGFDHVRVNGVLGKRVDIGELGRFSAHKVGAPAHATY